jgi:CubicO group peptidase (beta-lactamase class C family)
MRMRRFAAMTVVLLAGGCSYFGDSDPGPSPSAPDRAARSDLALSARLTPTDPGCSAAVGVDGQVVWTGSRGIADLASRTPISADTVFDVGSVSKQFTAAAILLLAAEGKLSTEDKVATRVPGLPAWARQVAIAQLIRHTSGIPDYFKVMEAKGFSPQKRVTHADVVRTIAGISGLRFRPGETFEYSNSNYVLLAEVVRHVSGSPLPDFLRQRVFEPLGLAMTVAPTEKIEGKATSYAGLGPTVADSPWEPIGDGGVQSTPSELVRWADNYRTGKVGGPALLAAQVADPVQTDVWGGFAYAAGILVGANGVLAHEGGWAGFVTSFQIAKDRRTAVAVACNSDNHAPTPIAEQLRGIWS